MKFTPLDNHLVESITALSKICTYQGLPDKALMYSDQALQFCKAHGNIYSLILVYARRKAFYADKGDWKGFFDTQREALELLPSLPEHSSLKARILGATTWACAWAGRYFESEQNVRTALCIQNDFGGQISLVRSFNRDLGLLLTQQNKYNEAQKYFNEALDIVQGLGEEHQVLEAYIKGFLGLLFIRKNQRKFAQERLVDSLNIRMKHNVTVDILEVLVWLGQLQEIKTDTNAAIDYYNQSLELKKTGRNNFICEALAGLVRVHHATGNYAAIPALLAEAEALAQQYEYNDHLTSLRLSQGHIAWDGRVPEFGSGFDAALGYYQQALIYALRYNRFLLDEVLWGGNITTPLHPIIPHCPQRGDEGQRMFTAQHDWWQTGTNDTGTPREETISLVPEGVPLLEAERIARANELGDGEPQVGVVDVIVTRNP